MWNPKVLKVFHAASQDLEVFHYLAGRLPEPIFDTQVAAMVAGYGEQVGYAKLAAEIAGAAVDKASQSTDWSRRPLSERQIAYALSDVTHLCEIYEALAARLEETGRASWVGEEMARLTDPASYAADPRTAFRKRSRRPPFSPNSSSRWTSTSSAPRSRSSRRSSSRRCAMRPRNIFVVAKREYLSRVKTKGFWLATVALPLLMGAWMVVPSLVMSKTQASQSLALVDTTGKIGDLLVEGLDQMSALGLEQASFEVEKVEATGDLDALREELDRRVLAEEIAAWVWVSEESLAQDRIEYHAESVSNIVTQEILKNTVSEVVRSARLAEAGYDVDTIRQLSRRVGLETVRISEEGSKSEGGIGAIAVAVALFFILYMMILIYGSQVMQGVLEEKSSRVVEVMLSAVQPIDLMAGKLAGICAAALTQLTVWISTAVVLTTPGLLALSFLPAGFQLPTLPPALTPMRRPSRAF